MNWRILLVVLLFLLGQAVSYAKNSACELSDNHASISHGSTDHHGSTDLDTSKTLAIDSSDAASCCPAASKQESCQMTMGCSSALFYSPYDDFRVSDNFVHQVGNYVNLLTVLRPFSLYRPPVSS